MGDDSNHDEETRTHFVLAPGRVAGHYRILEKIGVGGMGEVYLAEDTKLNRRVALKFLPLQYRDDENLKARFKREAQAAAQLNHPNIITIHEVGDFHGHPFFAMEHIEGRSLGEFAKDRELSIERIINLAIQIGEGLSKAHRAGVTHRDIKPANILIDADGRPKILDFGLATVRGGEKLTQAGSTVGTMGYMSPEQVRGEEADGRSDLFSFGAVLYELIARRRAFGGDNDAAIVDAIVNLTPEPLARFKADIPGELQRIVEKALRKDIYARYQSAEDMLADLRNLLSPSAISVPAVDRRKMLVVLPFENLGATEDEYFADGITDEITSRLAGIQGLGIISRTSARQYKNSTKSLRQIGTDLRVAYVLEGTIRWRRSSEGQSRVRITPQLIRVADDIHLWADRYDAVIDDIFEIQSRIAEQVAEALNVNLLESERRALAEQPVESTEAYDYYLRGNEYLSYDEKGLRKAEAMYQKAIELEPAFALAYAMLGRVYTDLYFHFYERTAERLTAAKEAVDKALDIAPELPEAHEVLGWYYYRGHLEYHRALEEFAIALRKQPNNSELFSAIASIKRRQGKWDEALEDFRKAMKLNPRHAAVWKEIGSTLLRMRQYAEAERHFDRAISLAPDFRWAHIEKCWLYIFWRGDTQAGRRAVQEALQKNDRWPQLTNMEVLFDIIDGEFEEALRRLGRLGMVYMRAATDRAEHDCLKGDVYRLMNRADLMVACYDSAREFLEGKLQAQPDEPLYHLLVAQAYAGLGRKEDAIREGQYALELHPVSKDVLVGTYYIQTLAEIYIMVGEYDLAIDQLEYLLSVPSETSVPYLKVWPSYAPLRGHPRFQKLMEKYK